MTQIDESQLAGIIIEGVLYGIFFVLFLACLHVLCSGRRHEAKNLPLIITSILMFLLATSQLAVDSVNIFTAFIDKTRPERQLFMVDVSQPIFAAKHAIFFTMMIIGDMVMIYRCYIVWHKNIWIIAFPAVLSTGSAVCAYQTIWAARHIRSITVQAEAGWGTALFVLSLVANSLAASLICYKIWTSDKTLRKLVSSHSSSGSHSSLMPILIGLMETGFTNVAYIAAYIAVLQTGNVGQEVMAQISTPLVGIIFSLMIVRVGLRSRMTSEPHQASQSVMSQSIPLHPLPGSTRTDGKRTLVHITRSEQREYDSDSKGYSEV